MPARSNLIAIAEDEKNVLVGLYEQKAIPVDQYEQRQEDLQELTRQFNRATGRKMEPEDIFRYMRTSRKNGKWIKLGSRAKPKPKNSLLTAEDKELLVSVYTENFATIGVASDSLAYSSEFSAALVKAFFEASGRILPKSTLLSAITDLRKRGYLPQVEKPTPPKGDIGFDDLDEAANQ